MIITPPSNAPVDRLTAGTTQLNNDINMEFARLTHLFTRASNWFWNNPFQYTPEEVAANYGTNCVELFELSSFLATLIGEVTGTTPNPVPEGWTFVANSDGSMTLTPPDSVKNAPRATKKHEPVKLLTPKK